MTLPPSSTSVCEQQSSKNRRRKPRDNKWEVRQTRRRTPTLSPPSLSLFTARVSPEGERRQRQALSVPEWLRERHITDRNVVNQTRNKLA